jgi:hypothetical protein
MAASKTGRQRAETMSANGLAFLFAAAVTVHDLEEALWLPRWTRAHLKLWFTPNPKAYWIASSMVSVCTWIAALGVELRPAEPRFALVLAGFALAMAINAVFPHLAISLLKRSYSPGTATGIVLNLPLGIMLVRAEMRTSMMPPAVLWTQMALYALLLGLFVFGSMFLLHAVLKTADAD